MQTLFDLRKLPIGVFVSISILFCEIGPNIFFSYCSIGHYQSQIVLGIVE